MDGPLVKTKDGVLLCVEDSVSVYHPNAGGPLAIHYSVESGWHAKVHFILDGLHDVPINECYSSKEAIPRGGQPVPK